ncbi:hypothetical protein BS78_03G406400 [Paspalum vaginatum]|nr:hypothetical protein BS78_03G406400 [Paspalum vaginatum]
MAPVILRMDVHCPRCARSIRKLLKGMHGVEDVLVSLETGHVVVAGYSLDASLIRWRIQSRSRKPVTVVSDGSAEEAPPDCGQMVHLGPPRSGLPPPSRCYGGGAWAPGHHQTHHHAHALLHHQRQHPHGRYVRRRDEPLLHDDDDTPKGCCIVQ